MPGNLSLFLLLISGFLFLSLLNVTRYIARGWSGPRLVFWAGTAAVCLALLARLLVVLIRDTRLGEALKIHILSEIPTGAYAGTLLASLILGVALPLALNLFIKGEEAVRITRSTWGSLQRLLAEHVGTGEPLYFTFSDRSVYVGFILSTPLPDPREEFFSLLPTLGGYIDEKTNSVVIVSNYAPLLQTLDAVDHLQILLPYKEVTSARVFVEEASSLIAFTVDPAAQEDGPPDDDGAGDEA